jgi:hypothetical protein
MTMLNLGALPTPGQMWDEQRGLFICITPLRRAIIAPVDEQALFIDVQWGPRGVDVPGACSEWDGEANTVAMAKAGSELAQRILEQRGLILPACNELYMLRMIAPHLIADDWYWSSTQYSADFAWHQYFADGIPDYDVKDYELRARAVRSVVIG